MNPNDATEVRAAPPARFHEARFTPGAIVADRYRIVSLLGGGGMGEVYRADDLKLGQRVALKYVPVQNEKTLELLYSEVRIGRQIAHPNVCRLYDVVEVDGQHFITMEFVDGEDLASLLRRIERLPPLKALAVARDLCSGLAAAHDRGFIHRDLKPANVMIDGRGSARITDFGLAGLAEETPAIGGTPLYMAPEQLDRAIANQRSDIYALGLVLYEMFTGRRVFDAHTRQDLHAQHAMSKSRPRSLVAEIDPAIEDVILRCIDEDPERRPGSVREVLAQLPGSDPLNAAVAAGETPSPEMVVAAGRAGDLTPARAWTLLALFLVLLGVMVELRWRKSVLSVAGEIKAPEVLRDRAREIIRGLGYEVAPHQAGFFVRSNVRKGPSAVPFLYRDSPEPLFARLSNGRLAADDPPLNVPGMTSVLLDGEGRLRELRRVAPSRLVAAPGRYDWSAMFQAAGLDLRAFREVAPEWNAPVPSDRRHAWSSGATRVEAASAGGRPVWFAIDPASAPRISPARGNDALSIVLFAVPLLALLFARKNVVRGRADTRGAKRIAVFSILAYLAGAILVARHGSVPAEEWRVITDIAGTSFYYGFVAWVCYLAIEPYVRRRWPHMLVGWTRLIGGRARDPLVGTEILGGAIAGVAAIVVNCGAVLFAERFFEIVRVNPLALPAMRSPLGVAYAALVASAVAVTFAFGNATIVVLVRLLLRRDRLAWMASAVLIIAAGAGGGSIQAWMDAGAVGLAVLLALRFGGLLACAAAFCCYYTAIWTPVTFDTSAWYFGRTAMMLLLLAGLGVYAFVTSLGRKPLFGSALLEDGAPAGR